jgi:hypothetical protein
LGRLVPLELRESLALRVLLVQLEALVLLVLRGLLDPQAVMLFGTSPGHIILAPLMRLAMWLLITVKLGIALIPMVAILAILQSKALSGQWFQQRV